MAGSARPETIARAYELGANGYLVKDFGMEKLQTQVKGLVAFWSTKSETRQIYPA